MNWEISQASSELVLWTGVSQGTRIWLALLPADRPQYDTGYSSPEEALAQWEDITDFLETIKSIKRAWNGRRITTDAHQSPERSKCPRCEGTGIYSRLPGYSKTCSICNGTGVTHA